MKGSHALVWGTTRDSEKAGKSDEDQKAALVNPKSRFARSMFVTTISVFARAANQVCFHVIRPSSKVATVDESDVSRFLAISRHRQMGVETRIDTRNVVFPFRVIGTPRKPVLVTPLGVTAGGEWISARLDSGHRTLESRATKTTFAMTCARYKRT